jgi:hypothetical protein
MSEKKDDAGKESRDELLKRLKAMSVEDLKQYESVTSLLNNSINVGGVLTILIMLFNPSLAMMMGGGLLLIFLATTGANTSKFRTEIRKLLETKDK